MALPPASVYIIYFCPGKTSIMYPPIFITGIGTDIGKTVVSAIVCRALNAGYWKPVQAGFSDGTDAGRIGYLLGEGHTIYPETYKLAMPASDRKSVV